MRIETFLKQSPVFQAGRIARKLDVSLTRVLRHEETTPFEALVLSAILFERGGRVKPSALAEAFETTRGNISHCISSLEAKALVERRIDADDARAVLLSLTPLGRRRAIRISGILDRIQHRLEQEIGSASLEATLRQMNDMEQICAQIARNGKRG